MPFGQLLLLGAIAGFTVYLGLPFAAMRTLKPGAKAALNGIATGILLFLAVEILGKVFGSLEDAFHAAATKGAVGTAVSLLGVVVVGLGIGLVGIPVLERYLIRPLAERHREAAHGKGTRSDWNGGNDRNMVGVTGGAASTAAVVGTATLSAVDARTLAITIAAGIGLHNFGEGLAIGQSAASGAVSLALLLIIGFGLHNMTEGFGIAAPLSGSSPSFAFIAGAGLLAGGPTFVGTLVGSVWTSTIATAAFLAVAGGSLVYVSLELAVLERKALKKIPLMASIAGGLLIGYFTDLVVTLAGA
ncbi:MAG TPA: ZIP family metal transporter [Spirochaetia bacterium]|nr:ZIP family metal transporter [Spirochaetia bacterium]